MPNLPSFVMPADAAEKSAAKAAGTDYYADLTDEERIEEGLPPREAPPKPEETPAPEKPAEAQPPEKPAEPEDEPDGGPAEDDAIEQLFEELAGIREDMSAALGKKPAETVGEKDEQLEALLNSEDPDDRALGLRLQRTEERIAQLEQARLADMQAAQRKQDDADFEAAQATYLIDGKPMTKAQLEIVKEFMLANPEIGARVPIDGAVRLVFENATKRKAAPAKGPAATANGNGTAVATVVTEGAAGGGSPAGFTPRPGETIESAMNVASERLFGLKRGGR